MKKKLMGILFVATLVVSGYYIFNGNDNGHKINASITTITMERQILDKYEKNNQYFVVVEGRKENVSLKVKKQDFSKLNKSDVIKIEQDSDGNIVSLSKI